MSELHALLIGIDDYFPDRLPDGSCYPSLQGATRDISRMALFLRDHVGLQLEKLRLLLSRTGEDGGPVEPPERRPTYANIVAAFKQLAQEAHPGDRVYIHYSGHGARMRTEYPGIKGRDGQDEALVPCDIFSPGSRYLRDLELAALVRLLVDRELLVTLVLDNCHAGGAMRSVAVPRGVSWIAREPVPSAVADPETLGEIWQTLQRDPRNVRGLTLQSWLPVARYALFAACRPDELAFEYPFANGEPQGALTYWLLDTLARYGMDLCCGDIHRRLVARIRGFLVSQTPMFLGDGEQGFLAETLPRDAVVRALTSPMVLRVHEDGRVLIDVGVPAGARVGARVVLQGSAGGVSAELAIRQVGATESWAEVLRMAGPEKIEPGAAVEVIRLPTAVRLIPAEARDGAAERALARLREALRGNDRGFVEVCDEGNAPDLCVRINASGSYEILDPGGTPFPNLHPLLVDAPEVVKMLLRRLDHLARFRNILTLESPQPADWLGIGLELWKDDPQDGQAELLSRPLDLRAGEALIVRVVNRSTLRLDFAMLDLAPDYSVTQLVPKRGSFSLLPLDAGQAEVVRVRGWLPPGYDEGNDVLKVIATRGHASLRWLELPPMDRPISYPRHNPRNPLERLFWSLAVYRPVNRSYLTPSEFPEEEWISAQVEIRIRR